MSENRLQSPHALLPHDGTGRLETLGKSIDGGIEDVWRADHPLVGDVEDEDGHGQEETDFVQLVIIVRSRLGQVQDSEESGL